MKQLLTSIVLLAAATSGFAAQHDSPWSLRLGIIFPRLSDTNGLTVDPGASFSFAYRAYRSDTASLEIESLGSAYTVSDSAGDSATFNISNLNLIFLSHSKDSNFFYGAVIGSAKPSASLDGYVLNGKTSTAYGPILGIKLQKGWFIEARYLFCDVPASRGTMILAGYRF